MEQSFYRIDKSGDVTILTLTWENVSWRENEELKQAFSDLLAKGAKDVVIDFTKTFFISSIVLASLVFMLKKTKEIGGDLVLCSLQAKVKEVLALTNLDKILNIAEDRKSAILYFSKRKK